MTAAAYPLVMLTALLVGVWLSRPRQTALQLAPNQRWAIALGAFCGGMIGSKLPFAFFDPRGVLCSQAWIGDGKTILFGLVGGYVGVELAKSIVEVRSKTGDAFAVPVAAAIGIGRIGCFIGGCCYGQPTTLPWGVDFGDGVRRHPTQWYEVAFHLTAALVLWTIERRGWFPRQRFKLYLFAYCAYRFWSEWLRPEPLIAWGLTAYQLGSLALVPVVAILWWHDRTPTPVSSSGGLCPPSSR